MSLPFLRHLDRELAGTLLTEPRELRRYSRDQSIYEIRPRGVYLPAGEEDLIQAVRLAAEEGCLLLGPMYRNEVVGYICLITDPDGNNVEFSVEQVLG